MQRVLKNTMIAGNLTAIVNVVIYLIALAMDVPLQVTLAPEPTYTIDLISVILVSIIPALGAAVVYMILAKLTKKPKKFFVIIAVVVFVLSLGGPLSGVATTSTKITLVLMHIIAALFITKGVTMRERTIPSEPLPGASM